MSAAGGHSCGSPLSFCGSSVAVVVCGAQVGLGVRSIQGGERGGYEAALRRAVVTAGPSLACRGKPRRWGSKGVPSKRRRGCRDGGSGNRRVAPDRRPFGPEPRVCPDPGTREARIAQRRLTCGGRGKHTSFVGWARSLVPRVWQRGVVLPNAYTPRASVFFSSTRSCGRVAVRGQEEKGAPPPPNASCGSCLGHANPPSQRVRRDP